MGSVQASIGDIAEGWRDDSDCRDTTGNECKIYEMPVTNERAFFEATAVGDTDAFERLYEKHIAWAAGNSESPWTVATSPGEYASHVGKHSDTDQNGEARAAARQRRRDQHREGILLEIPRWWPRPIRFLWLYGVRPIVWLIVTVINGL